MPIDGDATVGDLVRGMSRTANLLYTWKPVQATPIDFSHILEAPKSEILNFVDESSNMSIFAATAKNDFNFSSASVFRPANGAIFSKSTDNSASKGEELENEISMPYNEHSISAWLNMERSCNVVN